MISSVPLIMKFHGESASDNPRIDLYKENIIFDRKMRSKWGSTGPYIPPFKRALYTPRAWMHEYMHECMKV